jgi:predicted extracellular nuclease
VVANHFNSKGGDQPLYGRFQPPARPSETQRHAQAGLVHDFVAGIERVDPRAAVVVLGDLNDFDYSQTADILAAGGLLTDLPRTLPLPERYTYVFEGNSQVLDHILLSRGLAGPAGPCRFDYDVVHVNSEFSDQVSDHEPQVVRLRG